MEKMRMMEETTMRQSHWWLFDSHNNGRSQWLQSTLSALDDKTKAMLRIIEEDADSFAQLAEMYYKKRPQLVGMVEDFYRAHRSLAEQFDHLRHDPSARRISPLARSFCLSTDQPKNGIIDPHKSYDGCFTKLAFDSKDLFTPLSKGEFEEPLDLLLKPFAGRYTDTAYDSDGSIDSEVDDPVPYAEPHHHETVDLQEGPSSDGLNRDDLMAEIERLEEESMIQKKQVMEKEKTIEELKLKLSERATKVIDLEEEGEEIGKLAMNFKKEKERLTAENATLNKLLLQKQEETRKALGALRMEIQEQKEVLEEKDEEKRETIRQLSVAIEMLKGENRLLKKTLVANESNKRWNPFDSQVLKGFGKLLNCSIVSSQPSVAPL